MADEPFFPPPPPKPRNQPFRSAPALGTVEPPSAPPAPVIVQRADEPLPEPAARKLAEVPRLLPVDVAPPRPLNPFERAPRLFGVGLTLIGLWGVGDAIMVLREGGTYLPKFVVIASIALVAGPYVMVVRYSRDAYGRPNARWAIGAGVAAAIGGLVGFALLGALGGT